MIPTKPMLSFQLVLAQHDYSPSVVSSHLLNFLTKIAENLVQLVSDNALVQSTTNKCLAMQDTY